ncbi:hypothetical protein [Borrelia miyamotoi]|nr:hypothetical protein [Borrelia miyamotoi]
MLYSTLLLYRCAEHNPMSEGNNPTNSSNTTQVASQQQNNTLTADEQQKFILFKSDLTQ